MQKVQVTRRASKPPCRFCGRHAAVPCMSTRDMDPFDGLNTDASSMIQTAHL